MRCRWLFLAALTASCLCIVNVAPAAEAEESVVTYSARDTLQAGRDESADAQACLEGLVWEPGEFTVSVKKATGDSPYAFVRFPSPRPTGHATNDLVAMEWYAPKESTGEIRPAPAVIVVHESGSRMEVGRLFAKAIYAKGFHAFLIHLPHYGLRRDRNVDATDVSKLLPTIKQAIADVRRARDAVAVIPQVDASLIALQGTSLGGFVAATTMGLDRGYDRVFIMLAGGDLLSVVNGGRREAADVRRKLAEAGFNEEKLKELAFAIEPTRLAHRADPERLWIYTAKDDQVVPLASPLALQRAAKLSDDHHVQLWGDHYKVVIYFPVIIEHMVARLKPSEQK